MMSEEKKRRINDMCEDSWGMSMEEILSDMEDFDFDPAFASREDCIEFFVTLANRI